MEERIGGIIAEHRKKKNLTQKALADQLGITDKAVSKWERDIARPDIALIPKLAEIIDIPVTTLLNVPIKTEETTNDTPLPVTKNNLSNVNAIDKNSYAEANYEQEMYKDKFRRLLLKGALGFIAGFLFVLITSLSDKNTFYLPAAILIGFLLAGVPYGWELLERVIGQWFLVGHIAYMILSFAFKLVGAVLIGWIAYPIALFYNLMKAQKKGSTAKKVWTGVFVLILALLFSFVILLSGFGREKNNQSADNSTSDTTIVQNELTKMDATYFTPKQAEYITICKKAMDASKLCEDDAVSNGNKIVSPSVLKAAYFAKVKDPDSVHTDYSKNVQFTNALLIITSYRVNIANAVERDNWVIWFYPDFSMEPNNSLVYSNEYEHDTHLLGENIGDIYDWICQEYSDMDITELTLPDSVS